MIVGYARASSTGQSIEDQADALTAAGCEKIFADPISREHLQQCIEFVGSGDTLVVTRLDRLARSARDLFQIAEKLSAKGVALRSIQQSGIDTGSTGRKLTLAVLQEMAAFEADLRRTQLEGIERAKSAGVIGRKRSVDIDRVHQLHAAGQGASAIAKLLNISRTSVYRALNEKAS
jgi:DNA invertase Pin-like site-specific DNA recombinase